MVHCFQGVEGLKAAGIADDMWRLRYRTFIEEQKWPLPSSKQREWDCYDDEDAVYLVSFDNDGAISASARLIPTTGDFLMRDIFAHLVSDISALPTGPSVVEFTRYFVRSDLVKSRRLIQLTGEIFCSVFEHCLDAGVDTFLAIVDIRVLPQLYELGWTIKPLGLPGAFGGGVSENGGGRAIAIQVDITTSALHSTAACRQVALPVLSAHDDFIRTPQIDPTMSVN
ncbi:MAG: acyl-homoserine-lactone synthase [Pseudomonadota bacterium]